MKTSSAVFTLIALCFAQWGPDVRLTYDPNHTSTSTKRCIAAGPGDLVHVVFYDDRDGNFEIYYKCSTNQGATWEADTRLTNFVGGSSTPAVSVTGNNVHVVWSDERYSSAYFYEIFYKRSTDGGTTWGSDTRLTFDDSISSFAEVLSLGNNVHVVWHDYRDGTYEIYYKRSTDEGTTWGSDTRLTNDTGRSLYPSVAALDTNVYVVWHDTRDGNYEIYYKRSTDQGMSWGPDTRFTVNDSCSFYPVVSASVSNVYVTWEEGRDQGYPNTELYYKISQDGGTTWGLDTRLTNNTGRSTLPFIWVRNSSVYLVWEDWRDENGEIYYKRSTDGGITWLADTRLTNQLDWSGRASLVVADTMVHVVWTDERDNSGTFFYEVYYKRNPTGGVGLEEKTEYRCLISATELTVTPNPFRDKLDITFSIEEIGQGFSPAGGKPKGLPYICIYDATGRLVKSFNHSTIQLSNQLIWDGTNDSGQRLTAGVYIVRLETLNYTITKKAILLR
jgi:hypothetical protein